MPTVFNLRASNNATFQWTRDLSAFAAVYNLAAATIRMQARLSAYAPDPPAYEWVSTNSAHGQVQFSALTNLAVFVAPEADTAALSGDFVYDCRLEFPGGASIVIFGGRLTFATGVTRRAADLTGTGVSGIGDTVTVDGERGTSPVPLPLSLAAALAAVTPSAILAALMALPSAQLAPFAQAILAALPAYSGTGAAPVPTGEVFVDSSSFLVRAQ